MFPLDKKWKKILSSHIETSEFKNLLAFLEAQYATKQIFPPKDLVFNALNTTALSEVKVIILGQDPYHRKQQAHGLSFSVPEGVTPPSSLRNIYKEIYSDLSVTKDGDSGDLSSWAHQGVLLLNSVLTVQEGHPGSHARMGWESFTDSIISKISKEQNHCVFILWGSYAQKKAKLIDNEKHLIISSVHPSPLSSYRGFFGSKPFSQTNDYLKKHGKTGIAW